MLYPNRNPLVEKYHAFIIDFDALKLAVIFSTLYSLLNLHHNLILEKAVKNLKLTRDNFQIRRSQSINNLFYKESVIGDATDPSYVQYLINYNYNFNFVTMYDSFCRPLSIVIKGL